MNKNSYILNSNYPSATLPVGKNGDLSLNSKEARIFGEGLSDLYCFSDPFPHIVIDNFLPIPLIEEIHKLFPEKKLDNDIFHESDYYGLHKRQVLPESCEPRIRNIFHFFNSMPILQFLEGLTTIDSLIGDPYFSGGGFHEIFTCGKLGIHTDFRINEQLHLSRRLNMIIYLNKNWTPEFGGNLELWDSEVKTKVVSIAPLFNRCVIFNTDAKSYHGHPEPLNTPNDITRKSIALYYYTASKEIYNNNPTDRTMYVSRPNDGIHIKKQVYKNWLNNKARDFLPPVFIRMILKLKHMIW
jgi:Rps23 Pro-64 3,4-dihydroxylase Tpa1-like proline 4-hydroxylase